MGDTRGGKLVSLVKGTLTGGLVSSHLGEAEVAMHISRSDGLPCRSVLPTDNTARGVQTRAERRQTRRAVEVMLRVLFTTPNGLHRHAGHRLGHLRRLGHVVHFKPTPEPATECGLVQRYGLCRQSEHLGHGVPRKTGNLSGRPNFGAFALDADRAVGGFHGGMRQIRRPIFRSDLSTGPGHGIRRIATLKESIAFLRKFRLELLPNTLTVERAASARVPNHLQSLGALQGLPGVAGNDGYARGTTHMAGHRYNLPNPRHGQNGCRVERLHLATGGGAHDNTGMQQARRAYVQREHLAAVRFSGSVQPWHRLPDEFELLGRLQRGRHIQGQNGRGRRELTETRGLARGV